jgi:hypothetical protein
LSSDVVDIEAPPPSLLDILSYPDAVVAELARSVPLSSGAEALVQTLVE